MVVSFTGSRAVGLRAGARRRRGTERGNEYGGERNEPRGTCERAGHAGVIGQQSERESGGDLADGFGP